MPTEGGYYYGGSSKPRKPTKADYIDARHFNRGVLPKQCRDWLAGKR